MDNPRSVPLEGTPPLNNGPSWWQQFVSTIIHWSAYPQKYSVRIEDAVKYLAITTVIENDYPDLRREPCNYLPCFKIENTDDPYRPSVLSDKACGIVGDDQVAIDEQIRPVPSAPKLGTLPHILHSESSSEISLLSDLIPVNELHEGTAIGDGNCFFDSIRQLLSLNIDAGKIREEIRRNEYFQWKEDSSFRT